MHPPGNAAATKPMLPSIIDIPECLNQSSSSSIQTIHCAEIVSTMSLDEPNVGTVFDIEVPVDEPKVGMKFNSSDDVYRYYSLYARQDGFAVAKRSSRKDKNKNLFEVTIECSRRGNARFKGKNQLLPRPTTKVGCKAHIITCLFPDGKWRLRHVTIKHNHERSPGKAIFSKSNRNLDMQSKRKLELNDAAGIRTNKTFDSLQIEASGQDKLSFTQKDCQNYLAKVRRLRLLDGDATTMYLYFVKMQTGNSDFFYALDLDDKGRLRNVFWADARSRAACRDFGDVVTFDTTYLVNKYDMPFAPFVGVNHHGNSVLLGCGLISHEDTDTFAWLFDTWKACMWGSAPKAIITDQCMAMKNAIREIFADTRHRWCIWHIMKKLPEKLSRYKEYEKISWCLRKVVYDSLTVEEFEASWDAFIMKYELQSNTWLNGLYVEINRWVPAFVKDVFWAGMSSTQRSEGMNAYFDGYINSKTILKQFVEQYENALSKKVEIENEADARSWNSVIRCISQDKVEEQFQSVYTHDKLREVQNEFSKKMNCLFGVISENEYEVKEWIYKGEGEEKKKMRVSFKVVYNAETNEAHCNCRLFEFKGIVCTHQLMIWSDKGVDRVPEKYVLKRWCKNVKRAHTKIRISYDKSSTGIESRRHDFICNLFKDVAYLAEGSQEMFDMVVTRAREFKRELVAVLKVFDSNIEMFEDIDDNTFDKQLGDEDFPSKESAAISDPVVVRIHGRQPFRRKVSTMEKFGTSTKTKKLSAKGKGKGTKKKKLPSDTSCASAGTPMQPVGYGYLEPGAYPTSHYIPTQHPYNQSGQVWMWPHSSYLEHPSPLWRGPHPAVLEHTSQIKGWKRSQISLVESQYSRPMGVEESQD